MIHAVSKRWSGLFRFKYSFKFNLKKMTGVFEQILYGLRSLKGEANEEGQREACLPFASYLFHCIK